MVNIICVCVCIFCIAVNFQSLEGYAFGWGVGCAGTKIKKMKLIKVARWDWQLKDVLPSQSLHWKENSSPGDCSTQGLFRGRFSVDILRRQATEMKWAQKLFFLWPYWLLVLRICGSVLVLLLGESQSFCLLRKHFSTKTGQSSGHSLSHCLSLVEKSTGIF